MIKSETRYELGKIFLLGIITATVIFIPFIIFDKGLFLFYGDFNVQQIPFYKLAHEAVQSGNISWSFNTDLGANFIGSYSFYLLGSPFFWITLLFPNAMVPYLMAPLLILKFAVSSVTAYAYIRRFSKTSSFAMIGALMFAFCGFNVYNIFFNHFNDAVAFFPLILIGIEEAVNNNKKGYLAIAVFLNAIINYFFFFGQVIFALIYFLVRITDNKFKVTIKKFIILAFESIIGLCASMFLLLPSLLAISGNPRLSEFLYGWNFLLYQDVQKYPLIIQNLFFPPDIPARLNFFPNANALWSSVAVFLPLFTMIGIIAFFKSKKSHWAKKLLIICAIMAFVPGLNSIFYAFNGAYYARWFYMPILIMCLVSTISLENRQTDYTSSFKITLGIIIAFSFIGIIPTLEDNKIIFGGLPESKIKFWISIIIAVTCLLLSYYLLTKVRKKPKIFIQNAIYCVCLISVIYSIIFIISGKDISYSYNHVVDKGINGEKLLDLPDDEFYRIDVYDGMDNWPMFWNKPSIQAFHSIVPASVLEFYPSIGVERNVASRPEPKFYGLRGLTSVKYLIVESNKKDKNVLPGFEYIHEKDGLEIYENKYFIPMGFTYDKYISKDLFENFSKDERDKLLLKGIYLAENADKYSDILSELNPNQYISVSKNQYLEDALERKKETAYDFTPSNNGFSAKINLSKDNLVFFSVPFDKGWSAYVNGNEVEIEKANVGFMAVKANAGENTIEFIYKTPGLNIGIIISIISLFILVAYIVITKLIKNRKTKKG